MSNWKRQFANGIGTACVLLGLPLWASAAAPQPNQAPTLQVPIPGLDLAGTVQKTGGDVLAVYIFGLYNFLLGAIGIVAAVAIVIGGFEYLTAAGDKSKVDSAKKRIFNAIAGIVIAFTAYLMLSTISPNLVQFKKLGIQSVAAENYEGFQNVDTKAYAGATGMSNIPARGEIEAMLFQAADQNGIDRCIIQAIGVKESGMKANVIAHDENVPRSKVHSRPDFIDSGVKYSGTAFTVTNRSAMILDASFKNDDTSFDPTKPPFFGLDKRFTHGFGIGQLTPHQGSTCNGVYGMTIGGKCYTVLDLLNPQKNTAAMVDLIKGKLQGCGGNVACLFYRYAGSGCSARGAQCAKMKVYASCKGITTNEISDCARWRESNGSCNYTDQAPQ